MGALIRSGAACVSDAEIQPRSEFEAAAWTGLRTPGRVAAGNVCSKARWAVAASGA
jgi:hypothetical protein